MTHHPLCDQYGGDDGYGQKVECLCSFIEVVQRDMLAKCIAAVEDCDEVRDLMIWKHEAVDRLRALLPEGSE